MRLLHQVDWKKLLPVLVGWIVTMGILFVFSTFSTCNRLYDDTLRLHIRAASDTEEDQALKLLVRDRLVTVTAELTDGAENAEEAAALLQGHLSTLQAEAREVLVENACLDPVSVQICPQYFNTRRYETSVGEVTLPAGEYEALVVTIGKGQGHNWWCVLYPSLCLPAAEGETADALAHYTDEEQELVTGGYEIKFWLAEIWTRFAAWMDGKRVADR